MEWRRAIVAALCGAFIAPAAAAEKKVEYMAVLVGGKKVGHVVHTREVTGGKVATTEDMTITINRMGVSMTVRQVESALETTAGKPLSFKAVQDLGIMSQTMEGTIGTDGTVEVTITAGQNTRKTKLEWPTGAVLAEGLRLLSASKGLKEGTTYTVKAFTGALLKAMDVEVTIGAAKNVDLLGRIVRLTEVKTVMIGPTGRIEGTGYVNEDFDALKTVVPMLGMQLEMVACSKEAALAPSDPLDFFDKLMVASPTPLEGVRSAKSVTYVIQPTGAEAKLAFLETPNQKKVVRDGDRGFTVTVSPKGPAGKSSFPYKGNDPAAKAALKATRYLQCDTKEIIGLAKIAIGRSMDAAAAARKIEGYVAKYISDKNLEVGYASALEVAKSKQGDCTEHAVLAAAMCRAVGIPAQVVTGLAYVKKLGARSDVFVPHAWFRVHVGGKWVDYDAALGRFGAGHIALTAGDGEPDEFFGVIGTLGNFKMVKVTVAR